MRVLVTGATGFLGRHCLAKLVAKGFEVHAVSSRQRENQQKIRWHRVDLLDDTAAKILVRNVKPSHMLHLAWCTEHRNYWHAPENFAWVQASLVLMQEFANSGGRRFVGAGTCAEYDWSYDIYSETSTPCRPVTLYGAAKYATNLVLDAWAKQTGFRSAWGRMFFVYGPGQSFSCLVPSIISSLLRGEQATCAHGEFIRDFIYVDDAAAGFVTLLETEVSGTMNIASGEALKLKDLALMIGDLLDKRELVRIGEIALSAREPKKLVADVFRMYSELSFTPTVHIQDGILLTIDYLKKTLQKSK